MLQSTEGGENDNKKVRFREERKPVTSSKKY